MVESVVCLLANAYRLIDQIGSGGTSTVWRALAPDNSNVAVKVIPMDRLDREGKVRSRFNAEVSASRRLRSDHIVRMLDYGEEETLPSLGHKHGAFYIVFEYVSGITLLNKLEDDGCLDSDAFLELAIAVGSALSVAHDSTPPIVHRDIKPANIILANGQTAFAKLLDFGISRAAIDPRITTVGYVVGTYYYFAPEQFDPSAALTPSVDQYAFALTLWECLTGYVPGAKVSRYETEQLRISEQVLDERELHFDNEHAPALTHVFSTALNREPSDRYPSIRDFVQALILAGVRDGVWTFASMDADLLDSLGLGSARIPHSARNSSNTIALIPSRNSLSVATLNEQNVQAGRDILPSRMDSENGTMSERGEARSKSSFNKLMKISPQLAAVIGADPRPRTEVTSALWTYVKKHGLQDPANKRIILADDKLFAIFGQRSVTMFEMTAKISKHLK